MKKTLKPFLFIIAITGMISLAATVPQQQQEHKAKNLKVLPKDISHHDLDSIMHSFKAALGVKCGFCHAQSKENPKRLDFASDAKKTKLIARGMMKMTAKINKKYFHEYQERKGVAALACATCHRGKEHPEIEAKFMEQEKGR